MKAQVKVAVIVFALTLAFASSAFAVTYSSTQGFNFKSDIPANTSAGVKSSVKTIGTGFALQVDLDGSTNNNAITMAVYKSSGGACIGAKCTVAKGSKLKPISSKVTAPTNAYVTLWSVTSSVMSGNGKWYF